MRVLEERDLPIERIEAFASRSRPGAVHFRGVALDVEPATPERLRDFDVIFFAGGEDASETFVPALEKHGIVVIDNSATFRMRDGVPLLIPEVNADAVRAEHRLFPVGNCTAIILCTALAPVRDLAGLRRVHVASYQAVSGAGRGALEAFDRGEGDVVRNVVPKIGELDAGGESGEERKVRDESRKMLGLPQLELSAVCVRVPVRTAHSEAVFFETERSTSVADLGAAFERAPSIVFHRSGIVTPLDVEGTDDVHVARLRATDASGHRFSLFCVGDQLRKGAATNAVQILELLMEKGLVR
ncbi:MAG TPA: Asd/ArgC dimerization domain-containing protein [Candidatus Dormibacteraeota bacterium]|nr:Asd/ArgC dimerization domain-containing protein [Candidatus Dormibacteraeota bacterium]